MTHMIYSNLNYSDIGWVVLNTITCHLVNFEFIHPYQIQFFKHDNVPIRSSSAASPSDMFDQI